MPPPISRKFRFKDTAIPGIAVGLGIILIIGPLLVMLAQSFAEPDQRTFTPSFANFVALIKSQGIMEATVNTLICGVLVTAFSSVLGFVLAWIVSRTDLPGRSSFETLNLVPFFLSPYVGAISWIYLAAPYGGLIKNSAEQYFGLDIQLPSIYGLGGVIWVLTLFYTPYVYLFVIAPLRQMDGALEDAARVHGLSFFYTVRHITVPLLLPAILSGALIVFVSSAGIFDVPVALALPSGIPTIPTEIYKYIEYPTDFGRASSLGILIILITIIFTLWQNRYMRERRYDIVSGKGYKPRLIHLAGWKKWAALTLEWAYIGFAVVLPVLTLILVSLSPIWTGVFSPTQATLENYAFVLFENMLTKDAIINSIILAVAGATICVVIAFFQSYFLRQSPYRTRTVVDSILSFPLGIPPIIIGVAFLIVAVWTPLYGTLSLILLAYVARFFPYATKSITGTMLGINPELEQSARCCGASFMQSLWHVMLPLVKPGIIAAWITLAIIFVRELGATILLFTRGTETISVALLQLAARNTVAAAALAVIQILILGGAFMVLRVLRIRIVEP